MTPNPLFKTNFQSFTISYYFDPLSSPKNKRPTNNCCVFYARVHRTDKGLLLKAIY